MIKGHAKINTLRVLYTIRGKVMEGARRGKLLGYPTANIRLHQNLPEGIYVSIIKVGKKEYKAATFIGAARTFDEKDIMAESYILDFNENIYGKFVTLKLFKKIRENRKFSSTGALIHQIKEDVRLTEEFFSD